MHVPGSLAPTLFAEKPFFSKTEMYHGLRPAERRRTLPPALRARCRAQTWAVACASLGSNQSMLSIICDACQLWTGDHEYPCLRSITYDRMAQSFRYQSANDFLKFVRVYADAIKGPGLRKSAVSPFGQVLWVAPAH